MPIPAHCQQIPAAIAAFLARHVRGWVMMLGVACATLPAGAWAADNGGVLLVGTLPINGVATYINAGLTDKGTFIAGTVIGGNAGMAFTAGASSLTYVSTSHLAFCGVGFYNPNGPTANPSGPGMMVTYSLEVLVGATTTVKLVFRNSATNAVVLTTGGFVRLTGSATITPGALAANKAPLIFLASSQTIAVPTVSLAAFVIDDALPDPPAASTMVWSKITGPGTVTFSNPTWPSSTLTFSANGVYIVRLTAFDGSLTTTHDITITVGGAGANASPTIALPAFASPSQVTGTSTNLSVLGADDGGEAALHYTWATIGAPPAPVTFSPNGTNGAKNTTATFSKVGDYNVRVTVTDAGGLTVTGTVSVSVVATLTAIAVAPASTSVQISTTKQFTANTTDQFGAHMASTPAWSVSGGGVVDQAGLFTAGAIAGGPFVVTATASGKTGNASVDVTATATPAGAPIAGPATQSNSNCGFGAGVAAIAMSAFMAVASRRRRTRFGT